jgi:DNA-binding CsgD family transcriptional regulator
MLTPRQEEILIMLANGSPWKEIIHRLGISRNTLHNHIRAIREQLNAQNTTHAVSLAIRQGVIR